MENKKTGDVIILDKASGDNSPDWLRSFNGCEHYTDEEAIAICESLDILATIMLENAAQKLHIVNNHQNVYIYNQNQIEDKAA